MIYSSRCYDYHVLDKFIEINKKPLKEKADAIKKMNEINKLYTTSPSGGSNSRMYDWIHFWFHSTIDLIRRNSKCAFKGSQEKGHVDICFDEVFADDDTIEYIVTYSSNGGFVIDEANQLYEYPITFYIVPRESKLGEIYSFECKAYTTMDDDIAYGCPIYHVDVILMLDGEPVSEDSFIEGLGGFGEWLVEGFRELTDEEEAPVIGCDPLTDDVLKATHSRMD